MTLDLLFSGRLPILAFDSGANRESVPSGHDCILFSVNSSAPQHMAREIVRRMGVSKPRVVIDLPSSFTLPGFITSYATFFVHLLESHLPQRSTKIQPLLPPNPGQFLTK